MTASKVEAWRKHHEGTLKSLFKDYCGDTGAAQTSENYDSFVRGMYKQCRH